MIMIVPELAFMTGVPDMKNSRMEKDMMQDLILSPRQKYQRLTSLLCRIKDSKEASEELRGWGLRLDLDICRVEGRILPMERINLRHNSFFPNKDLSWNKEVMREASISTINMNFWLLIYPTRLQGLAKDLVTTMESLCTPLGMRVSRPTVVELEDDRVDTYARSIQNASVYMVRSGDRVQLLLCIMSSSSNDLYRTIKRLCCMEYSVPSQVISAQSLTGPPSKTRSVVQKVLLQINCKLGGELWGVDIPL
ncbi:PIWL2 protein, partial [Heliornis fulica]|nr:PIWL2 protein [Heliornis fulica]